MPAVADEPEVQTGTFPEPLADVDKETVKTLSIAGLSDKAILARFPTLKGVTLRQWRARDPLWSAVFGAIRRPKPPRADVTAVAEQRVTSVTNAVSESLSELHSGTALQLAQASAKVLKEFAASPAPVTDWQTAQTAYKVQRLAAGIDKEGGEVKVNLAMFTGDAQVSDAPAAWEIAGQVVESGPD